MRELIVLPFLALGCAVPSEVEALEVVANANGDCPEYMCGSNSPEIDHLGIHDVNVNGLPNANGFQLKEVRLDDTTWHMHVVGGRVELTSPTGPTRVGEDVVGAVLELKHDTSGVDYEIRIEGIESVTMWAQHDSAVRETPAYLLTWDVKGQGDWKSICSLVPIEDDNGMPRTHAVLFEGDRINATEKRVYGLDTSWFNIGCAGHALAKLHLTGHTHAANVANGYATTRDERTTMLKMFAGDYCGSGHPYTVAGIPLVWKDHRRWMTLPTPAPPIEAGWTVDGAACLNTPRVLVNGNADSDAAFDNPTFDPFHPANDFRTQIETACHRTIPTCVGALRHHVVSANP